MGELLRTLKERGVTIEEVPLTPWALAGLIALVEKGDHQQHHREGCVREDVRVGPVGG